MLGLSVYHTNKHQPWDYQTLLDQMNRNSGLTNEVIEVFKRETAGYQMSPHILSYMEKILEKMRIALVQTHAHHPQISRIEQLIHDAKGSESDNKQRWFTKLSKQTVIADSYNMATDRQINL